MQQRGMVTFELAVGILSAAVVATVIGWGISLLMLQSRCTDVAGQIARQLGRGDTAAAAKLESLAPARAAIITDEKPEEVMVRVTVDARFGVLGPLTVTGSGISPRQGR